MLNVDTIRVHSCRLRAIDLGRYVAPRRWQPEAGRFRPAQPTEQRPGNGQRRAAPPASDRLTSKQLAAIHGVARREGVTRDELLGLVAGKTGKDRIEILTRAEASSIIDALASPGHNGAHPSAEDG
jgi:hypothetical protein